MLTGTTPEQIHDTVHNRIRAVLVERDGTAPPITSADLLNATLGLSSLDLAMIVAELEVEFDVDPFAKLVPITSVRTVGDLVGAYHAALFADAATPEPDADLGAAAERGLSRLTRRGRR